MVRQVLDCPFCWSLEKRQEPGKKKKKKSLYPNPSYDQRASEGKQEEGLVD